MPKKVRIFQIAYNEETLKSVDSAFIALDNLSNERPDWSEYWPIRNLLLSEHFEEDELIGFFSPRFTTKTAMTGAEVHAAIERYDAPAYSFSPYFDVSALYINPVLQGERQHPGLLEATKSFLAELGVDLPVEITVSDQHTTVFCNYLVARPALWRKWFAWAEQLFQLCERGEGELAQLLTANTEYTRGARPLKVFVMERLLPLLLEYEGVRAKLCIDLQTAPRGLPKLNVPLPTLVICDALKAQYRATGNFMYLECFQAMRQRVANLARAADAA